jgi:1-phosphatidylinositol-4-phosphate 5-kinase
VSGEHEPSVILKDNDIKYKIRLPRNTTERLLAQIRADADFLYSIGVMDYSLLGRCFALICLLAAPTVCDLSAV